jgi:putative PIN family toxin of toxin-antitoxin system
VRVVLDPNVIISALLSPAGAPARVLLAWQEGEFELIASQPLLAEVERALAYPKLAKRVEKEDAVAVVSWLGRSATIVVDPAQAPSVRSVDPGDDDLIALAVSERALLVSGDKHLLELGDRIPIVSPAAFLEMLDDST